MSGRLNLGHLTGAAALMVAFVFTTPGLQAQDASGRFRVLIPNFFPVEGTNKNFGKDTAEELRDAMRTLPTHMAIEKDELEDKLDDLDVDMDDLDCLGTRQVGAQMNAQVALCASYEETGDRQVRVEAEFWDLQSNQSFALEPFTMGRKEDKEAARHVLQKFEEYVQALRIRDFCFRYYQEGAYADALRNCEQALELNPSDLGVRKQRARVLFEMAKSGAEDAPTFDREVLARAYEEIAHVAQEDPLDDEALSLAGYIATQLDRREEGRSYYNQYLELNPGDVAVRRNIAYQIFEAGDPEGAMLFIQEGLEIEASPDLLVDLGNYAFAVAARQAQQNAQQDSSLSPEVAELYRTAVEAYMEAFEAKGADMAVSPLKNVVNAYVQLDEHERAVEVAERILEVYPEEAGIWWTYGTALQRMERTDEALDALARVAELEPNYPNLFAIQGRWLLDEGRLDDAVEKLQQAVESGNDPNQMARLVFADGYAIGNQRNDYDEAIRYLTAAKGFDISASQREELNFWHGYFLFKQAEAQQAPNTLQTARATLPKFQRAKELFQAARGYGEQRPQVRLADFLENTDVFIEIQEAIIKREGGR